MNCRSTGWCQNDFNVQGYAGRDAVQRGLQDVALVHDAVGDVQPRRRR
jgi:hypothetical protein